MYFKILLMYIDHLEITLVVFPFYLKGAINNNLIISRYSTRNDLSERPQRVMQCKLKEPLITTRLYRRASLSAQYIKKSKQSFK